MLIKLQNKKLVNYGEKTTMTNEQSYAYKKDETQIDYPIHDMYRDYDYERDYYRMDIHTKTASGDNFYEDELRIYITYPDIPLGEYEESYRKQKVSGNNKGASITRSRHFSKSDETNSVTISNNSYNDNLNELSSKSSTIQYKQELALKITNKDIPTYYWNDFMYELESIIQREATKQKVMLETLSQLKIDMDDLEKITNKKLELALYEFSIKDFIDKQIEMYKNEYCPCCKRYRQDVFCLHYDEETQQLLNKEDALNLYNEVMHLDFSGSRRDSGFQQDELEGHAKRLKEVLKEIEKLRKL